MQKLLLLALGLCLLAAPLASAIDSAVEDALVNGLADDFNALVQGIANAEGAQPWIGAADLSGANQVPSPVNTNTTANFVIALGKTKAAWWLGVGSVKNMIMSHLHYGNSTTNGPVVALLGPSGSTNDIKAGTLPKYSPSLSGAIVLLGTFTADNIVLPNNASPSLADLQAAINANNVYVNVHTEKWPAGIVRAQITAFEGNGR